MGSSSQGQWAEDEMQGRGCGEGGKESQWSRDHGLKRLYNSLPSGPQRRVVKVKTEVEKSAARPSRSREQKSVSAWDGPALTGRTATDRGVRIGREDTGPTNARTPPDTSRGGVTADGERVSSKRRAEASSVSKASDTRPSASSSHHHRQSSGDRRSLSSSSSRASPDLKSPPSHHERRRESADRTGPSYVARREVQLSPKIAKSLEKRAITVISSPARPVQVEESATEVDGPEAVTRRRWRTARQLTARPVMAQQGTARPVTAQRTARQLTGRQTTGRQVMTTQHPSRFHLMALHFSLMTRRSRTAQNAIRRWEWTGRQAMEPQQEPHQCVGQTPPSWQGPAVYFSRQYRLPSTRQRWSILCVCGHCYSDRWTRVRLQISRPARLYSRQCLLPDMTQHPGDQTRRLELQRDYPGLQRDFSGPRSDGCWRQSARRLSTLSEWSLT